MKFFTKKPETTVIQQSRDYRRLKKIKIFNIFLIIMLVGTLSTTSWFIYNNVYTTIQKITDITLVENVKNFETINFTLYEKTTSAWIEKTSYEYPLLPNRDPFNKTLQIPTSTPQTIDVATTTVAIDPTETSSTPN